MDVVNEMDRTCTKAIRMFRNTSTFFPRGSRWWLGLLAVVAAGCTPAANVAPVRPVGANTANTTAASNITALPANRPAELEKVTLQLNWFPEAEHGGFYAALVHGEFEREGLAMKIVPGGPGIPVTTQVASGQATFGVSDAQNVLLAAAQQAHTVAVMAPLQHSPRCILVHAKSGIRRFEDLKDVTLAMNASSPFSLVLQKKLKLSGVKIVPYGGNVGQFLLDENLAQQGYVFSEPLVAKKKGAEPISLMVSDLGFDPYTSVLIAHPDTIRERPDLVRKMVAASIRGWQAYLTDPAKTNAAIHELNEEMELDILDAGVDELKKLCSDKSVTLEQLGAMTAERWQALAELMVEIEAIPAGAVDPRAAFTSEFLPAK